MKRWWSDTLFKRLFVLMWVALVVSHLAAYAVVVAHARGAGPAGGFSLSMIPVLPSLPPTPGLLGPEGAGAPRDAPASLAPTHDNLSQDMLDDDDLADGHGPELPRDVLLLDYGVRFAMIALAALWGARWLSAPMRRLVGASQALASSIGGKAALPRLNDRRGTVEVREAARVFNDMAQQLDAQFRHRGLLVAAISHDLRTPLTRMRMRLESLAHEPAAQRCIADLREMNELIDSVLEVFRGEGASEPTQRMDVFALVQAMADDLVEQGNHVSAAGLAVTIEVQPQALRRALSNLMGNALRYGNTADVMVFRDPGGARIVIDDDGPGIPDDQLDAVFQPFYRVDNSRSRSTGGAGLGLYIARELIQRQGGRLTLSNRPDGGLRVTVSLRHPN